MPQLGACFGQHFKNGRFKHIPHYARTPLQSAYIVCRPPDDASHSKSTQHNVFSPCVGRLSVKGPHQPTLKHIHRLPSSAVGKQPQGEQCPMHSNMQDRSMTILTGKPDLHRIQMWHDGSSSSSSSPQRDPAWHHAMLQQGPTQQSMPQNSLAAVVTQGPQHMVCVPGLTAPCRVSNICHLLER